MCFTIYHTLEMQAESKLRATWNRLRLPIWTIYGFRLFRHLSFCVFVILQLTESKSAQALCQIYAAVSYICIGDPESNAKVNLVFSHWPSLFVIPYMCLEAFLNAGLRVDWTSLQNNRFFCWSTRENFSSISIWIHSYEAGKSTRSPVNIPILNS